MRSPDVRSAPAALPMTSAGALPWASLLCVVAQKDSPSSFSSSSSSAQTAAPCFSKVLLVSSFPPICVEYAYLWLYLCGAHRYIMAQRTKMKRMCDTPSVKSHWYFHLVTMLRERLKIWKSNVNVAMDRVRIRMYQSRWKRTSFSVWFRSFSVSMRLESAVKTQKKIRPLSRETGSRHRSTKLREREWLCLKESTDSRMKSRMM
mmetsp:Transcript_27863/g.88548  ORF Transcript_27863/g.88548 Transcript_27863/m.88548 type:complete len:204 (+) Transcript_27863:81-692(+)